MKACKIGSEQHARQRVSCTVAIATSHCALRIRSYHRISKIGLSIQVKICSSRTNLDLFLAGFMQDSFGALRLVPDVNMHITSKIPGWRAVASVLTRLAAASPAGEDVVGYFMYAHRKSAFWESGRVLPSQSWRSSSTARWAAGVVASALTRLKCSYWFMSEKVWCLRWKRLRRPSCAHCLREVSLDSKCGAIGLLAS